MSQRVVVWSLVTVFIIVVLGMYIYAGMQRAVQEGHTINTSQSQYAPPDILSKLNAVPPMTEEEQERMMEKLNTVPPMTEEDYDMMLQKLPSIN